MQIKSKIEVLFGSLSNIYKQIFQMILFSDPSCCCHGKGPWRDQKITTATVKWKTSKLEQMKPEHIKCLIGFLLRVKGGLGEGFGKCGIDKPKKPKKLQQKQLNEGN